MGFWSALGDIGGGFIGDPGLGDQLSGLFGDIGQTAGNAASQGNTALVQQAQLGQGQDKNALQLYQEQLQAAKDKLAGSTTLANQVVRGDTMQNAKDATISGLPPGVTVPTITGGLRPSLMGPNSQQAGGALSKAALMQLLSGGPAMPTAPTMTPLPEASALQKGLGLAGLVGSIGSPIIKALGGSGAPAAGGLQIPGAEFDPNMIYGGG